MLGPLIESFEGIPEEDMDDLDILDRQVVVDETGIDEQAVETFTRRELNWERLEDCNDSYDSILIPANF